MKPGIYEMSNKDYHAAPGVSSSQFKPLLLSMLHYRHWLTSPHEMSEEMLIGSAVHALFLDPESFKECFAIRPSLDKRTKDGKAEYERWASDLNGRIELNIDVMSAVNSTMTALMEACAINPILTGLFTGTKEKSFFWIDEETGLLCKCRPDCLTANGVITDLKVTYDASPANYTAQIAKMNYYMQAAFYLEGVKETILQSETKIDIRIPDKFVFVPVERKSPHGISMLHLDALGIRFGTEQFRKLLKKLASAAETQTFEGYSPKIETVSLPNWIYYK